SDTLLAVISTLSLHDALPIFVGVIHLLGGEGITQVGLGSPILSPLTSAEERRNGDGDQDGDDENDDHQLDEGETLFPVLQALRRSEEHTSELQSRTDNVCRLE